jgi:CMP-N,N'-diacetyllegionaminic acid synthase
MFDGKKILAVIPARGGSKGVPRKNVRLLGSQPLIGWTIDAARRSEYIDRLILSSEDEEIISVARECGCEVPFVRPDDLADDDTPGIAPVLHAVQALEEKYDYLVLLQPTSPFRQADDIDGAIRRCIENKADSCVSVTESEKHPAWMFYLTDSGHLTPVLSAVADATHRQQLEPVYALNGAVYVVGIKPLLEQKKLVFKNTTLAYPMPSERSMDIDTQFDFILCELIAKRMEEGADVL